MEIYNIIQTSPCGIYVYNCATIEKAKDMLKSLATSTLQYNGITNLSYIEKEGEYVHYDNFSTEPIKIVTKETSFELFYANYVEKIYINKSKVIE